MNFAALNRNVDLRNLTYKSLYQKLDMSDTEFVTFLQQLGLLHSKRTCRKCGSPCTLINDGKIFRCSDRKNCGKNISMRTATMFEGSHLTLKQIFEFAYYWCRNNAQYEEVRFQMQTDTKLSTHAYTDWKQYFLDVCAEHFIENPIRIGGPGVIVEIDETFLARRKYQRGRVRPNHGQWIFGGVVRGDASQCFLVPVQQRNAATLLPIIQQFVLPGSMVCSDLWKAYGGIDQIPESYEHHSVNHSVNFVDPDDPRIHTQSVENCWGRFKREHRRRQGCRKYLLVEYINEFMWRQEHKGDDVFYHFWEMVSKIYPVELNTPTPSEVEEVYPEEHPEVGIAEERLENVVEGARLSLDRVVIEDW